jgi:hypothetical protein
MPHTPIAHRAVAGCLAAALTFGLMHTLDLAATQHRDQLLALAPAPGEVQQILVIGNRAPRS